MPPPAWKELHEHIYESFAIFRLRRSIRVNPRTDKPCTFFLMDGKDWVNVIALTDDNQVVLIRQIRHGIDDFTIEIPGGCVEPDEQPAEAARRELLEETGFAGGTIEPLGTVCPNPAMQAMRLHCYCLRGVPRVRAQQLDPGEDIQVILKPLPEALAAVRNGEIGHALVVAAFGLFLLHSQSQSSGTAKR